MAISKNPVLHKRSKHINIAFQIVRRECVKGHVVLAFIPTKENIAELLTKALTRVPQEHLTGKVMAGMKDGKAVDVTGEPLVWEAQAPVHGKLYQNVPPGLNPEKGDKLDLPAKNRLDSIRQKALALGGRFAKRSLDCISANCPWDGPIAVSAAPSPPALLAAPYSTA